MSDGENTVEQSVSITVTNENDNAPAFSSGATASVAEGETAAYTASATDADGDTITYSLSGTDAALFDIDASTGEVTFKSAPDFESPADADGDNVYAITVTAGDGTNVTDQDVSITVTNENDNAPAFIGEGEISIRENETAVTTLSAEDLDGDSLSFSVSGGSDAALFTIDPETGALSFVEAPDFEKPADADGDNIYQVVVAVSDGESTVEQILTVTVTDENDTAPEFTSTAEASVDENTTAAFTAAAEDVEGQTPVFSISGGADSDLFSVDSSTGEVIFNIAPNFEAPGDADGDNSYEIELTVSDGVNTRTQAVTVTVNNVNDNDPAFTGDGEAAVEENQTIAYAATADDADGEVLSYAISGGADAALFAIDAETGDVSFLEAPDFENPADADGDNVYETELTVSDGERTTTRTVTITVGDVNDAPEATADTATVGEDGSVVIFVRANDVDQDGDALSVITVAGQTLSEVGDIAILESGAEVILNADGSLTYEPLEAFQNLNDGDTGEDSFTYTVTDPDGEVSEGVVTVTITGEDEAPAVTTTLTSGGEGAPPPAAAGSDGVDDTIEVDDITEVSGARLTNLDAGDEVVIKNLPETFTLEDVTLSEGSINFAIDLDGDGVADGTFFMSGSFNNGDFDGLIVRPRLNSDGTISFGVTSVPEGGGVITGRNTLEVISGTSADEIIYGLGGNDLLAGNGGDDEIRGGEGDDRILGGLGDDLVFGDAGDDVITDPDALFADGGEGDDTISAADGLLMGGAGSDTLTATSDQGVTLVGAGGFFFDEELNTLFLDTNTDDGGAADTLIGGAGRDSLVIGYNDSADGGDGVDSLTAIFSAADSGVTLDLRVDDPISVIAAELGATIVNVENLSTIIGSEFGDTIHGGQDGPLNIRGEGGDDVLTSSNDRAFIAGGDGNDTIDVSGAVNPLFFLLGGGAGDDMIIGSSGNDQIFPASNLDIFGLFEGNDVVDGGAGFDLVSFANPSRPLTADLTIDLNETGVQDIGFGTLQITNVESLEAGDGNDTLSAADSGSQLRGAGGDDTLIGRAGGDQLYGGDGADTLAGGDGGDYLEGGAGADVFAYAAASELGGDTIGDMTAEDLIDLTGIVDGGLALDFIGEVAFSGTAGEVRYTKTDTQSLLEIDVDGDGAADHVLAINGPVDLVLAEGEGFRMQTTDSKIAGSNDPDTLFGTDGDDAVFGLGGDDRLFGRAGDDLLEGGDGQDFIDGGDGDDRINGGASFDFLRGGRGADRIDGGAGDDFIDGREGADILTGGAGSDEFEIDAEDLIGEGEQITDFSAGDIIDMNSIAVVAQELGDVANITFIGDAAFSGVAGEARVSTVDGVTRFEIDRDGDGVGDDTLDLTNGAQIEEVAPGSLIFVLAGQAPVDLTGDAGTNRLVGTNTADTLDGAGGNDTLFGASGDDTLIGGAGNDALHAGLGADTVDGGEGFDTVRYESGELGLDAFELVVTDTGFTLDGIVQDSWTNVEAASFFSGSVDGDVMDASGATINVGFWGFAGDDTLIGGAGDDTLQGGVGADIVTGSAGADEFDFFRIEHLVEGDVITDFSATEGDLLDFRFVGFNGVPEGGFAPGRFNDLLFLGDDAFNGEAGVYRAEVVDGDTIISFDMDGDGVSDGQVVLQGFTGSLDETEPGSGRLVGVPDQTINGTEEGDELFGAAGDDVINGLGGDDMIEGRFGDDMIDGGAGDDFLIGGAGNDTILGGDGDDFLQAGAGNDTLDGGEGADYVQAGRGANTADGGASEFDVIEFHGFGFGEIDLSVTEGRFEEANTGSTVDHVNFEGVNVTTDRTGDFNDRVDASAMTSGVRIDSYGGDDVLIGGDGADMFFAGEGDDVITGGGEGDQIHGNGGANTFVYNAIAEVNGDTIFDFDSDDVIDLEAVNAGELALTFIGEAAFSGAAGEVRYVKADGQTTIEIDSDGDGVVDQSLLLNSGEFDLKLLDDGGFRLNLVTNITGTENGEFIPGTPGDDVIDGLGGDDFILGGEGDDTIDGGEGSDLIRGEGGDDVLSGGVGNDFIFGGAGSDQIFGGAGNDFLRGEDFASDGGGVDTFDGGEGVDRISFYSESATEGVHADLSTGQILNDGFGNQETMTGIEGLGGGTVFVDTFIGDDNDNLIIGGAGDILRGNGGDDFFQLSGAPGELDGGEGNDRINGFTGKEVQSDVDENGDGVLDWAYPEKTQGVHVDLGQGLIINDGYGESATIASIEQVGGSFQGAGEDILIGSDVDNVLNGYNGNDLLEGRGGADTITGDDGDDVIVGGEGADILTGGEGADVFRYDTLAEVGGDTINDLLIGDVIDLTAIHEGQQALTLIGEAAFSGVAGEVRYVKADGVTTLEIDSDGDGASNQSLVVANAEVDLKLVPEGGFQLEQVALITGTEESDNLFGTSGDDVIEGLGGDDFIFGNDGDDLFIGGAGDDYFNGGAGVDTYQGGEGNDRISFYDLGATEAVYANLATGEILNDGHGNVETMDSIESLGGGTVFADTFIGDDGNNLMLGGVGDVLRGAGGDDNFQISGAPALVDGGAGNDTINGFTGKTIQGDVDADGDGLLDPMFPEKTQGVHVDLSQGLIVNDGYGESAVITGIENVGGSFEGAGEDQLIGDDNANELYGYYAGDLLEGRGGDDSLFGGSENDTLIGGEGADSLTGGVGLDTFVYDALSEVDGDTITDLEVGDLIQLSGIDGGELALTFIGEDGFTGAAGEVRYIRADGATTVEIDADGDGAADQTLVISNGEFELIQSASGGFALEMVNDIVGTSEGDTLDGSFGADRIEGLEGDDTIRGNDGADQINGGAGNDFLIGENGNDRVDGGDGNDFVQGGPGDDTLFGGAGDDYVQTQGGVNTADGGDGFDTVAFDGVGLGALNILVDDSSFTETNTGSGATFVNFERIEVGTDYFGDFDDVVDASANTTGLQIRGNGGNDTLTGGSGNDFIDGGNGDDAINGGAGNDFLIGGFGNDTIDGGDGNDFVQGGPGDDTLFGGAGNDFVQTQGGVNTADGGDGFDTVEFDGVGLGAQNLIVDDSSFTETNSGSSATFVNFERISVGTDYFGDFDDIVDASANTTGVNIRANGGNDTITGGSGGDRLYGGTGENTIAGGSGDDRIRTGDGSDVIDGGDGSDLLQVFLNFRGVDVTMTDTDFEERTNGLNTTFTNIETVLVSTERFEVLDDFVDASAFTGDITIQTHQGNDVIITGAGDDILRAGSGNDTLTGGAGADLFHFDGIFGTGRIIDFNAAELDYIHLDGELGGLAGAVIVDAGAGLHDGETDAAGLFSGAAGGDATGGVLIVDDGSNSQILIDVNGDGDFTAGTDKAISVDGAIADNGLSDDVIFIGGERVFLDGTSGDDVLVGGPNGDWLTGFEGDDQLFGNAGNDFLRPGAGQNIVDGGEGDRDRVRYDTGEWGTDPLNIVVLDGSITDGTRTDTLIGIEQLTFFATTDGDDVIDGSGSSLELNFGGGFGNDQLFGGSGDDFLQPGAGSDTVDGGDGYDRFAQNYFHVSGGVDVVATDTQVTEANSGDVDTLLNIELIDLEGGVGDDVIDVSAVTKDVQLLGTGGTDSFILGAGSDILSYLQLEDISEAGEQVTGFASGDGVSLSSIPFNGGPEIVFIGEAAFSGVAGEVRYEKAGGQTTLLIDGDGDGVGERSILFTDGEFDLVEENSSGRRLITLVEGTANSGSESTSTSTRLEVDFGAVESTATAYESRTSSFAEVVGHASEMSVWLADLAVTPRFAETWVDAGFGIKMKALLDHDVDYDLQASASIEDAGPIAGSLGKAVSEPILIGASEREVSTDFVLDTSSLDAALTDFHADALVGWTDMFTSLSDEAGSDSDPVAALDSRLASAEKAAEAPQDSQAGSTSFGEPILIEAEAFSSDDVSSDAAITVDGALADTAGSDMRADGFIGWAQGPFRGLEDGVDDGNGPLSRTVDGQLAALIDRLVTEESAMPATSTIVEKASLDLPIPDETDAPEEPIQQWSVEPVGADGW